MNTKNRSVAKELTTANQDIYTVPSQWSAKVSSILIANETDDAVSVDLDWYQAADTTYYTFAKSINVPSNSIIQITDSLYLQSQDKLRGLASANSAVTVTVTTYEHFKNA